MLHITDATTPDDFAAVRQLAWTYRDFLASLPPPDDVVTTFAYEPEAYAKLLDNLETLHAPDTGAVKLARLDDVPVGCGMLQTIAPGDGEIKRLFVSDAARGSGAGRALMMALIDAARGLGLTRLLLDTGRPLTKAQRLYRSIGFQECDPYWSAPDNIAPRLVFFELKL